MRRRAVAALALAALVGPGVVGAQDETPLPALDDLGELAKLVRQTRQPALLFFSTAGCAWCAEVRRGYLRPRLTSDRSLPIREISIVGKRPIRDLDGKELAPSALAHRFGIRVVPVVHFVDDRMAPLVEPLIGLNAAFYESYLDVRIAQARDRLRG